MLSNFAKALGHLGVNASNMNHKECEKNIYKFEDETIQKHWLCFYAFYKAGHNDALNELQAELVRRIK
ncbi:hypothetical protein AVV48_gp79 [Acinetobacter phage phiAC-1]|uniref:hypothetical protein n=1 Tax=Acinetobacter phage phiAC-1 TaxID=1229760 RepID=UPI00028A6326|nr:hypothetical protein AVV48_gp79 [Acinetobacter phage phiAC-1]AFU62328.1 hypothetical protein phiAC-1_0079 [Acinetobacter phage phiAC-1]